MWWVMAWWAAPALAGEPARCEARWTGPDDDCPLAEEIRVDATWRTEAGARRRALRRLRAAAEAGARFFLRSEADGEAALERLARRCGRAAAHAAHLECARDPSLAEPRLCRSAFGGLGIECALPEPWPATGPEWRAREETRAHYCTAVRHYLAAPSAGDACAFYCLQEVELDCRPPPSADFGASGPEARRGR